jgi:glyoxylase-like metal-dependent hydrolase (beta-lactamase superfamily II)
VTDRQFGPIHFICGENRGRYPYNHSLFIEGPGILIDPACSEEKLSRLSTSGGVKMVWLSHWHEDHFAYLGLFDESPLWISERDLPPITDINLLLDWYGIVIDDQRAFWKKAIEEQFRYKPRKASRFLKDGEVIALDGVTIEVIPTPGHTPGHLAFYFREEGILFMGDYDLTAFGPWYGDLYSSIDETVRSIKRMKEIPARVWITGHDRGLFEENPGTLWEQYEHIIYQREEKLLSFLTHPSTLDEILSAWLMYGKPREPLAFFEFGERALVTKHLDHLEKRAMIARDGNRYIRKD